MERRLPKGTPPAVKDQHKHWDLAFWNLGVQPAAVDHREVGSRADVFHDVGVFFAGHVQRGVVGLAHRQEVRRLVPSAQLDDVRDEGRGAEPKHMHTCEQGGGSCYQVRATTSPAGHTATGRPPTLLWYSSLSLRLEDNRENPQTSKQIPT